MDFYLDNANCIERLINEYKKYGSIIIAYDFDNTVYDFHNEGICCDEVISLLRQCRDIGRFICFTASSESRYNEIQEYLDDFNIPCDAINESFEGTPQGGKVYYNILLDDRAGLASSYAILKEVLHRIEFENKYNRLAFGLF